ncbi:MAG TPA: hypothetical protein VIV12_24835 [Streptosporangiaceae bacterium]
MALQGPIPVEFAHVFAHGAFAAGGFEPMRDFDASSGDRFVQAKDNATGQPVWAVEVIDADPAAREKTAKVKVAAAAQPVLPPAHAGMPFVPVEFTGMTVTPYVNQAARLAYSLRRPGSALRAVAAGPVRMPRTRRHERPRRCRTAGQHGRAGARRVISKGGAAGTGIPAAPGISPGQQTVERASSYA